MIHLGDMVADRTDMLARFRATFGQDVWIHRVKGWTLIGLNPSSFETESGSPQMAWLRETLDGCAGPIGLFLHEPWFSDSPGRAVPRETRRMMEALFDGHDLRFVARGHIHQLRELDGIGPEWLPSIAFVEPAEREGAGARLVGLARLTLDRTGHHFDPVEVPGTSGFDPADYVVEFLEVPAARELAYA